jgi:hypothetical protein
MAFDTTFFNGIEGVLLFHRHTTMAIDTFDHIQLAARPVLRADPAFSLNQSLDGDMAVLALDFLDLLSMMASRTVLLKRLPVTLTGGMAVQTFQPLAGHMGFMRKLDIVERDGTFFNSNMAETRAGHLGLKLSGLVPSIEDRQGLFGLVVGAIEEFEGIFDIVNTLAQKNKVEIMAGLIEKILGLLKSLRPPLAFAKLI